MRLLFAKSKSELPECGLGESLARIKDAGCDASELYLPGIAESDEVVRRMHADVGLDLVAQIVTDGETPAAHAESLRRLYARASGCGAVRVNCRTGTDWFRFAENVHLVEMVLHLEMEHGVAICHETHRGRALCNAPETPRYLAELSDLRLKADLSDWQVVHETDDLSQQACAVDADVDRGRHIRARVGCSQAPQVSDPCPPEFAPQLGTLLAVWRRILRTRGTEGVDFIAVTTEFGLPPYQPVERGSGWMLSDPGELNL